MSRYVDGFITPVPKKNLKAYKKYAQQWSKIWKKLGAVEYVECMAEEVSKGKSTSFPRSVKMKSNETVFFSWITYKSKADRNRIWAKIMKEKKYVDMFDTMPFDGMRMIYGGFKEFIK